MRPDVYIEADIHIDRYIQTCCRSWLAINITANAANRIAGFGGVKMRTLEVRNGPR